MRRGMTLVEVELALFVFAVGVLAMAGLYPLGFRENRQAQEDVSVAAAAESVMSRIVSSLSDTNLTWSAWREIAASGSVESCGDVLVDVPPGCRTRITVTEGDPARLCVGVRVARSEVLLDSTPLFYTEVRFQGRGE